MKIIVLLALAAGSLATPAIAQDATPATYIVRHADLDLAVARDVRKLDLRIDRAARAACGTAPDYDLTGRNAAERCRRDTVAALAPIRREVIASARATGPAEQLASR